MVKRSQHFSVAALLQSFWPLFLISAFLPILFFSVQTKSSSVFSLFSRADSPSSIHIWLEPSTIIARAGQPVTVRMVAELDKPQNLLSSLTSTVTSEPPLDIQPNQIEYTKPFGGKIVLGTMTVTSQEPGTYTLKIPKETINTGVITVDEIITGGATFIVK